MGSIFDGILRCVLNNAGNQTFETEQRTGQEDPSDKTDMEDALLRNIEKSIADMPMLLKCEHKPGSDDSTTQIKGHPVAIMAVMHKLLNRSPMVICEGNKEAAVEYIRYTCEQVTDEILSGGV